MTEISEKEIEAAREVLEQYVYDKGGCEAQQVPAMVRKMLEAAARVREEVHPDDAAVDRFAAAMKAKLKWEREERGRHGWNDPEVCSEKYLARLLIEHLAKGNDGNFEDVANFCMMLHQRGAHPRVLAAAFATAGKPSGTVEALKRIAQLKEVRRGGGAFDYEPALSAMEMYEIAFDALSALAAAKPEQAVPSRAVKALDEDDYEEIISAAAINMRKATSGIRGQVVTVQDSLDWWVMKETERRILSSLTAGKQ